MIILRSILWIQPLSTRLHNCSIFFPPELLGQVLSGVFGRLDLTIIHVRFNNHATDSQNNSNWMDLLSYLDQKPCSEQHQLKQVVQDHVQMHFKYLFIRSLIKVSRQCVAVSHHSHGFTVFSWDQMEFHVSVYANCRLYRQWSPLRRAGLPSSFSSIRGLYMPVTSSKVFCFPR